MKLPEACRLFLSLDDFDLFSPETESIFQNMNIIKAQLFDDGIISLPFDLLKSPLGGIQDCLIILPEHFE